MKPSYKLSLWVDDYGERQFTSSGDVDDQGELARSITFDFARAFSVLNSEPSYANIIEMLGGKDGFFNYLSMILDEHDYENNLTTCLSVTVDVDKLVTKVSGNEKGRDRIRKLLDVIPNFHAKDE